MGPSVTHRRRPDAEVTERSHGMKSQGRVSALTAVRGIPQRCSNGILRQDFILFPAHIIGAAIHHPIAVSVSMNWKRGSIPVTEKMFRTVGGTLPR